MREKRLSLLLAILLVTSGGGAAAVVTAQTSREVAPEDFIVRGNAKYAKAEYESAIEEYRRITPEAGERYAQSLYNIGVCYYELWRTEEAIAMYRKAVEASGGRYPKALYALGVALADHHQIQGARLRA